MNLFSAFAKLMLKTKLILGFGFVLILGAAITWTAHRAVDEQCKRSINHVPCATSSDVISVGA